MDARLDLVDKLLADVGTDTQQAAGEGRVYRLLALGWQHAAVLEAQEAAFDQGRNAGYAMHGVEHEHLFAEQRQGVVDLIHAHNFDRGLERLALGIAQLAAEDARGGTARFGDPAVQRSGELQVLVEGQLAAR